MSGAIGGPNCPLDGKLRESRVHVSADSTVRRLWEELQEARQYALSFDNLRVSAAGQIVGAEDAANMRVADGMSISFMGPNRGG